MCCCRYISGCAMFDRMSASLLLYLRDTQGRVVQSVLSVMNVAIAETMEKESPSQRVLAVYDDDTMQSIFTSLLSHASSIVRGKAIVMLVLLLRARPLVLLPMFAKKLAHGLEKAGKDSDAYVSAAVAALVCAVDEFIAPSLAALQKEITQRSPQGVRGTAICSLLKLLSECSRTRSLFVRRPVAAAVCALLKQLRDASAQPFVEYISRAFFVRQRSMCACACAFEFTQMQVPPPAAVHPGELWRPPSHCVWCC